MKKAVPVHACSRIQLGFRFIADSTYALSAERDEAIPARRAQLKHTSDNNRENDGPLRSPP